MRTILIAQNGDVPWRNVAMKVTQDLGAWAARKGLGADAISLWNSLPEAQAYLSSCPSQLCLLLHPYSIRPSFAIPARYLVLVSGGSPPLCDSFSRWAREDELYRVIEHGPAYEKIENFVRWYSYWADHSFSEEAFINSSEILRYGVLKEIAIAQQFLAVMSISSFSLKYLQKDTSQTKQKSGNNMSVAIKLLEPLLDSLEGFLSNDTLLLQRLLYAANMNTISLGSHESIDALKNLISGGKFTNNSNVSGELSQLSDLDAMIDMLEIWIVEVQSYIADGVFNYE